MTISAEPREGDVIERAFEGRALKHFSSTGQRYLCLAYPCPNIADWFYLPANSDLCQSCVEREERQRQGAP